MFDAGIGEQRERETEEREEAHQVVTAAEREREWRAQGGRLDKEKNNDPWKI